jgi:hypothetical protein
LAHNAVIQQPLIKKEPITDNSYKSLSVIFFWKTSKWILMNINKYKEISLNILKDCLLYSIIGLYFVAKLQVH